MIAERNLQSRWLAAYVRPKYEKKIIQKLADKQVEHYCPFTKVVRQWSDRKKVIEVPLFSGYIFVKITDKEMLKVREIDGVINFVYWLQRPAVIKEEEIDIIKMFLKEYDNVSIEKKHFSKNDIVRITGGPLLFQEGVITEVFNKTVKVDLPSLGYQMMATIDKDDLELLSKNVA
ncbi:UpxY family transcription antiterminator [Mucilaginibacter myungsuensis]|uniref:UpxY family transcription antiterminator n=2 Tax=Mucilaginibacter myungsuensis TaxID=649104 RepID=A0A929PVR7_9SPHI|nr:UpxY family transcription antiterminator [Mucilaginibacter myungsuensis]